MNRFILMSCAALSLALVAGCGKGSNGSIGGNAAVVNGETISQEDWVHYLEVKGQVQVVVDPSQLHAGADGRLMKQPYTGAVVGSLGLQALTDLVQQTIVMQLAKDQNVSPSNDQIEADLADKTKQNPKFVQDLTNAGYTLGMIRKEIGVDLAIFNLLTQGITVSDADVQKYIADHPKEFIVPESVDMIWLLVPDEATKGKADADLKSGRSFITVAQAYSVAPNAQAMTYHFPEQYIPRLANYDPKLMDAVKKAKEQSATDWIKFTEGWAKFYINKKMPERKLPIDATLLKNVRKALMRQMGAQGKDVNARIADKLKASKIEIDVEYLKDPWQRYMESLQVGTPTTGPGASNAPKPTN